MAQLKRSRTWKDDMEAFNCVQCKYFSKDSFFTHSCLNKERASELEKKAGRKGMKG